MVNRTSLVSSRTNGVIVMRKDPTLQALEQLHEEVDEATAPLRVAHQRRLQCKKGCSDCCVDNLSVFEVEADRIRARHAALLEEGTPAPPGRCAFLDAEGACRIYADRPYVCRTQGLPLRWWDDGPDGVAEFRDICSRNEPNGPPLVALKPDDCWTLGPFEGRLAQLESERSGGGLHRIRIRDLFRASCPRGASR